MPLYQYRCSQCGVTHDIHTSPDSPAKRTADAGGLLCELCPTGRFKRVFSFSVASNPYGDGFVDPGTKTYVRTATQHLDACKVASEEATLRTGLEHRFRPVDADQVRATMDDTGMKSTHDRAVAEGRQEPTARLA